MLIRITFCLDKFFHKKSTADFLCCIEPKTSYPATIDTRNVDSPNTMVTAIMIDVITTEALVIPFTSVTVCVLDTPGANTV